VREFEPASDPVIGRVHLNSILVVEIGFKVDLWGLVLRLVVLLLGLEVGTVDLLLDVGDGRLECGLQALLLDLFSVMAILKLLLLLMLMLDQRLLLLQLLSKALVLLLGRDHAR
jgi:hypothetical protein